VDRICSELGVKLIMPLWKCDSEQIISDLVDAGFKTIIVSVKAGLLGKEWLGRPIDRKFVRDLRSTTVPSTHAERMVSSILLLLTVHYSGTG